MRERMTCSCYAAWEAMVHEGIEQASMGPSEDVLGYQESYREAMRSATNPKNSRKLVFKSEEKGLKRVRE